MRKWLLACVAVLFPLTSHAACDPTNAPQGSPGCYPKATSVLNTDYLQIWKPSAGQAAWQLILVPDFLNGLVPNLASPGPIGNTTPNTGAFTTLSATGITGTPISGSTGSFTTLSATGITATPISGSTGAFTTLTASAATSLTTLTATRVNSNATGALLQINPGTSADSVTNDWLFGRYQWIGTITGPDAFSDGQIGPARLMFTDSGNVTSTNATVGTLLAYHQVVGSAAASNTAGRTAFQARMAITGQVGPAATIGPVIDNIPFVMQASFGYAQATQGGQGGWTAPNTPTTGYFRGSVFGGNDNVFLKTGATNYLFLMGREIDVGITGTSNVYGRIGLNVAATDSTKQADGLDDIGVLIQTNATTVDATGFKNGLQFGSSTTNAGFTDSMIKFKARVYPATANTVPRGLDFSEAVFSDAFIRGPSNTFVVSPVGVVTGASYVAGSTAGANCPAGVTAGTVVVLGGIVTHC
jgi:hypothetical protein